MDAPVPSALSPPAVSRPCPGRAPHYIRDGLSRSSPFINYNRRSIEYAFFHFFRRQKAGSQPAGRPRPPPTVVLPVIARSLRFGGHWRRQ